MHAAKAKQRTRTRSITAKVTVDEEAVLKAAAENAGLTVSEWSRQALLGCAAVSPDARLLLAEFLALRTVIVRLYGDQIQGLRASDERLKVLLQQAETSKFDQADSRI